MRFASRQSAGQELGLYLKESGITVDIVLGLPRGGVVVAAEVAKILQAPLDVLVVRKIGHPENREFAIGALAEADVMLVDRQFIGENHRLQESLVGIMTEEKARLQDYQKSFHGHHKADLRKKTVLLVDDGLATGATAEAAVRSAREQGAKQVFLAVPASSRNAVGRLSAIADKVIALIIDPNFIAVGQYYQQFSATTDAEVLALLREQNDFCLPKI